MDEEKFLAQKFEENRAHLRAVAYRMLGSLSEADDAVQESWLRLSRADTGDVKNLGGWLTTVVARVCLDALRSRKARAEESLDGSATDPSALRDASTDPESEAVLADSVGVALLVVLETLAPAERLAFVLHDLFGVSFDEVGAIVGRSPEAARQLASRARRRVQGAPAPDADLSEQRAVVDAFLAALRGGDVEALVAVLDPDVVFRSDSGAAAPGTITEIRGARAWAPGAIAFAKTASAWRLALVDGCIGLVLAPRGHLTRVLTMKIVAGKITNVEVIGAPARLARIDLAVIEVDA